jgi:hypothetical protein
LDRTAQFVDTWSADRRIVPAFRLEGRLDAHSALPRVAVPVDASVRTATCACNATA